MTTALVLTGGGARGAYQAGVLAGIADCATDPVRFPIITGVSAGGINATSLAADRGTFDEATARLRAAWDGLTVDQVFRSNFPALTGSVLRWATKIGSGGALPGELRGLLDTRPLRHYLADRIDFEGIEANIESGRLRGAGAVDDRLRHRLHGDVRARRQGAAALATGATLLDTRQDHRRSRDGLGGAAGRFSRHRAGQRVLRRRQHPPVRTARSGRTSRRAAHSHHLGALRHDGRPSAGSRR